MFVPMWLVWVFAVLVLVPALLFLAPFALLGLVWVVAKVGFALRPPKPRSILDPRGERMARGTPQHEWYATPYLTEEERRAITASPRSRG